jgi:hypothetical protein
MQFYLRILEGGSFLSVAGLRENPDLPVMTHVYRDPNLKPLPARPNAKEYFPWSSSKILNKEMVCVPNTATPRLRQRRIRNHGRTMRLMGRALTSQCGGRRILLKSGGRQPLSSDICSAHQGVTPFIVLILPIN